MDERWRLFVAVPLPDDLRRDLAATVEDWRNELAGDSSTPDLRWTDPDGWHVTLAFLGMTSPDAVRRITDSLRVALADHNAFELPSGELGAFPRPAYARVIWYGVHDDGKLASLARSVRDALGVDDAAMFRAHVTLARLRAATAVAQWLATHRAPPGVLPVEHVLLMRSHLGPGPARYAELAAVPLAGAVVGRSGHG